MPASQNFFTGFHFRRRTVIPRRLRGAFRGSPHQRLNNCGDRISFRGYSRRDGDADFKFLARDTSPTYVDNRPLLVANKPEIREYIPTRRDVVGDVEVSQFSDEITVNCAPLVQE